MSLNKFAFTAIAAGLTAILSTGVALADSGPLANITSKNGITVGGAIGGAGGKFAAWGGTITLTESDAFLKSNGKCAFNVAYDMANVGGAATAAPFKNWLVAKGTTVAINSNLALNAGAAKQIFTQPYLPQGTYELQLKLDAENSIAESDETNNVVAVKINFEGLCGAPAPVPKPVPKPDLVSTKGIAIGGKSAAWGGSIALKTADAFLQSNGKCAFNVSYDVGNNGAAPAGPAFVNRIYSGTTVISQQSGLSVDAGKTRQVNTQAYLVPGASAVRLVLDADNNIAESNEGNNITEVKVTLDSQCGATQTRK